MASQTRVEGGIITTDTGCIHEETTFDVLDNALYGGGDWQEVVFVNDRVNIVRETARLILKEPFRDDPRSGES